MRYKVWFRMQLSTIKTVCCYLPEGRGIIDIKDGFWLDRHAQFCFDRSSESVKWIPPSQLVVVEKVEI